MKSTTKKVVSSATSSSVAKSSFSITKIPYRWVHFVMVVFIYLCCTWMYGDIFQRAQQDCYVSLDSERMTYVLRQPLGEFYWVMR